MDTHRAIQVHAPVIVHHHSISLQEEVFGRILVEHNYPRQFPQPCSLVPYIPAALPCQLWQNSCCVCGQAASSALRSDTAEERVKAWSGLEQVADTTYS